MTSRVNVEGGNLRGPAGRDGVNAIPADEFIGEQISDPDSKTREALDADFAPSSEVATRAAADIVEANARTAADANLQTQITSLGTTGLAVNGPWTNAAGYAARTLVTYSGVAYVSNAATATTDVPGASGKWVPLPAGNDPTAVHLASPTQLVDMPPESGYVWALVDSSANVLLGVTIAGEVKIPVIDTAISSLLPVVITAPESGFRYAITDEAGNILFGIRTTGEVVLPVAALGLTSLADEVTTLLPAQLTAREAGYRWVLTDEAGNVLLGVRGDGPVVAPALIVPAGSVGIPALSTDVAGSLTSLTGRQDVAEITGTTPNRKLWVNTREGVRRLITSTGDPSSAYVAPGDRTVHWTSGGVGYWSPVIPPLFKRRDLPNRTRIVGSGDSFTADGTYLARVASNLGGLATVNLGMSGWASADIATRFGGLRPLLTVTGNSIPASGGVAVVDRVPVNGWRNGHTGSTYTWHGYMDTPTGQIPGTLAHAMDAATWTFTRDSSGSVTACPPGTPFVCTDADAYRDSITLILVGRNNTNAAEVVRDVRTIAAAMEPYYPQYVVLSVLNAQSETAGTAAYDNVIALNLGLAAEFGDRYYDWRTPFIHTGMARAGLIPTSGDITAIGLDAPPASLMQNDIHPNVTYGYPLLGDLVTDYINAKGWITT